MANIKEVAKKAGVGIGTVSRVINKSGYVSPKTRQKVESVIIEMNFYSNEIAKSMARQRNNIIAFIVPNITHHFFGSLANEIEDELYKHGYSLLICSSSENLDKEIYYINLLKKYRVDGLIILTNNDIETHLNKNLPIISFDRTFSGVLFVTSDNYNGGVISAQHLVDLDCKNLAFIGDDAQGAHSNVLTEVRKRRLGFMETAQKLLNKEVVNYEYPLADYNFVPEEVFDAVCKNKELDGIFCNNDNIAAELIKRLEDSGRHVPKDIKIIGFDGGETGFNLGYSLTSVSQNTKLIAQELSTNLINLISGKPAQNMVIPVKLIKGKST